MDSTIASPSRKSQKLLNSHIVDESEDRISNLPDSVLHHILSLLPTKYAVGTCILSKRWQFMWTSISNIDFCDFMFYSREKRESFPLERTSFSNFVERVLTLHDASIIKKFRLICSASVDASRVHTWISAAIRHGVQELELSTHSTNIVLPYCLFICESLTILKLGAGSILKVPTSICFPSLKTFHLDQVTFIDELSTQKLFSNCPVLQELSLTECVWKNIKSTTIRVPSLKRLTIDYIPYYSVNDMLDCKINVYAENLIYFNCSGDLTIDILLYDLSSLVDASLNILLMSGEQQEKAPCALKLLGGIRNVESLTISDDTFGPLWVEGLLDQLPTFSKLTHLEVDTEVYYSIRAVIAFLQRLPTLECLVFSEGLGPFMPSDEVDWTLEPVPQCFKSCLKRFSIKNFHGGEPELLLLKFILKNALVLERMKVFISHYLSEDLKKREEFSDQLQMLPRGSASCDVVLL